MTGVPTPWGSTRLDRRPGTVAEVAMGSLGLYSTPPVSHLEFAARLPGYRPAMLDAAFAAHQVVGLRTLRGSGFLIPTELLAVTVPATRERNTRAFAKYVADILTTDTYAGWSSRIDDLLSDRVPRTVVAIKTALDPPEADRKALNFVINQMVAECRLVGTGVPKGWRSAENSVVRWVDWLPRVRVDGDPEVARQRLAVLYLTAWGPATAADLAWWGGLTLTQARAALAGCGAESFPADSSGYFSLPGVDIATDPPSGVRLLPWWDTLFVTWKDRSRFLPAPLYPFVYDRDGNAASVVLLDGKVAGVWNLGDADADLEIRAAPFKRFTAGQWKAIDAEAQVIAGLAGSQTVRVTRCDDAPNLVEGRRNLFLRPLK